MKMSSPRPPFVGKVTASSWCFGDLAAYFVFSLVQDAQGGLPRSHRAYHKYFTVENTKRVLAALEKIRPVAEWHKVSFAQLIINGTIHEPGITSALVGARTAEQATHNAGAINLPITSSAPFVRRSMNRRR